MALLDWPLAFDHTRPQAGFRTTPEDFRVRERLGFEASGDGEFSLLEVEKRAVNTAWVADRLAQFAGVTQRAVSWSGLKDRIALARQYFSVHLPGKSDPNWQDCGDRNFRIVSAHRHHRKLRRGTHRSNDFELHLRTVGSGPESLIPAFENIVKQGVPNYFGPQRFGRGGSNLAAARRLFEGQRLRRQQRSFALSAARSWLFNCVLARRVIDRNWHIGMPGDVYMLRGRRAVFGPEPLSEALIQRMDTGDIDPTGPLWGAGEPTTDADAGQLERLVVNEHAAFARGLAKSGMDHQRRALRLAVSDANLDIRGADAILRFSLLASGYATSVVRELIQIAAPASP